MERRVCPEVQNTMSYTSAPSSPGRSKSSTPNGYFLSVPASPSRTPPSDDFRFGSLEGGYDDVYADELFCEGRIVPLKLPPRLQCRKWEGRIVRSTATSPRVKMRFGRRHNRNDEFDPFVMALEKVKENKQDHLLRKSRSLSPLKWGWGLRRSNSMGPTTPSTKDYSSSNSNSFEREEPRTALLSNPHRSRRRITFTRRGNAILRGIKSLAEALF